MSLTILILLIGNFFELAYAGNTKNETKQLDKIIVELKELQTVGDFEYVIPINTPASNINMAAKVAETLSSYYNRMDKKFSISSKRITGDKYAIVFKLNITNPYSNPQQTLRGCFYKYLSGLQVKEQRLLTLDITINSYENGEIFNDLSREDVSAFKKHQQGFAQMNMEMCHQQEDITSVEVGGFKLLRFIGDYFNSVKLEGKSIEELYIPEKEYTTFARLLQPAYDKLKNHIQKSFIDQQQLIKQLIGSWKKELEQRSFSFDVTFVINDKANNILDRKYLNYVLNVFLNTLKYNSQLSQLLQEQNMIPLLHSIDKFVDVCDKYGCSESILREHLYWIYIKTPNHYYRILETK